MSQTKLTLQQKRSMADKCVSELEKKGIMHRIGKLITAQYRNAPNGKRTLIERSCRYIADFVYTDNASGQTVVEDTKGVRTKEYIIKRKLMLHVHNIQIHEI